MIIVNQEILHGHLKKSHNDSLAEIGDAIQNAKIVIPPIRKGNGVKPIKFEVMKNLLSSGWDAEHGMQLEGMRAKPLDGYKEFGDLRVGFEWETGNISSSFRALMKLYKGLIEDQLDFGVHVLPSRGFYQYLTDRVGNFRELIPYLNVYRQIAIPKEKVVIILVVEHDRLDSNAPAIPKGRDGMSLGRRGE